MDLLSQSNKNKNIYIVNYEKY